MAQIAAFPVDRMVRIIDNHMPVVHPDPFVRNAIAQLRQRKTRYARDQKFARGMVCGAIACMALGFVIAATNL